MVVVDIAPQVDRLVWAVNRHAGARQAHVPVYAKLGLGDYGFSDIGNLVPALRSGPLTETVFLSRYRYRSPADVRSMVARLVEVGCLEAGPRGYTATDRLQPVIDVILHTLADVAAETWAGSEGAVASLSPMVRVVVDAAPGSELLDAYRAAPEPEAAPGRLHQRLAILRLVRNEAHAKAWRARGFSAADMVALTALWSGEPLTTTWAAPPTFINEGLLTDEGRKVREEIEEDTNANNQASFDALTPDEQAAFLDAVTALPGTPP